MFLKPGDFQLVRCQGCGLVYLNPQPSDEEKAPYYSDGYFKVYDQRLDERWARLSAIMKKLGFPERKADGIAAPLTGLAVTVRVMDVGCGSGDFLAFLKSKGWQVWGTEVNPGAVAMAKEKYGLTIFEGKLEEAAFEDEFFDVVTLYGVFDHIGQPIETLTEIERILKPGGLLVIFVHNLDCLEARLFKSNWSCLHVPCHVFFYSPSTLRRLLEMSRFEVVGVKQISTGTAVAESIINMLGRKKPISERLSSNDAPSAKKKSKGAILGVVEAALGGVTRITASAGKGSTFEMYARKKGGS